MRILSLAGTAVADWSETHWEAFAEKMDTDKRVLSWERVSSELDPLGKSRPAAKVNIDLEKGETLEGIYSVGAICNKMNKPQWAIDEGRAKLELDNQRRAEELRELEAFLFKELDAICRQYRTTETMIRAVVRRVRAGWRLPDAPHWLNAIDAFTEGYGGSWGKLLDMDRIRQRGVTL